MSKSKSRWRPSTTDFHSGIKQSSANRLMHTTPRASKREIDIMISKYEEQRASNPLYEIAYNFLIRELVRHRGTI